METITTHTLETAADWAASTGVDALVFGFLDRALLGGVAGSFCATRCPLGADGRCDYELAHRFGCYEAERAEGQNIYYCPASLVFAATVIVDRGQPSHGLISGPFVMGPVAESADDLDPEIRELAQALPERLPDQADALVRLQQFVCGALSTPAPAPNAEPDASSPDPMAGIEAFDYPFEVEKQLVRMIHRGDRAGAAELINKLLASLYLASDGDLARLRHGAAELITLFSRAAIDGGADAASIFGERSFRDHRLAGARTLEEVSGLLVSIFNRFVGYVFDFSQFQHANVLRQTVNYIRANYADRISLTDVAHNVSMSANYLSSIFSAEMGMSFTAYVQSVRIEKSKDLLIGTNKTIAEIAAESGFADQSYFNKVFTKATGMSPTRFRREEVSNYG